jgi:uncharacterized Ntn-hydrolase superfamily protein
VVRTVQRGTRPARLLGACALLAASTLLAPPRARATYSIVALDLSSGQAGGAGTSCVGSQLSVYEIFGAAPGSGVMVAQAALNTQGRDRAVELLMQGADAPDVIAEITGSSFDVISALRQYAVIDARGEAAGFTGDSTMPYADDVQGRQGDVVYSVQGNILTGEAVLTQAAAAFAPGGCDLVETLMLALEAGAHDGQGDSRCTPDGIPSDGAFIRVDLADGALNAPYLELQVDDTAPANPIAELRMLYDEWRGQHPCPSPVDPMPDAGVAPDDAGVAGAPAIDAAIAGGGGGGATGGSAAPSTAGSGGLAGTAGASGVSAVGGAGGAAGGAPLPVSSGASEASGCATAAPVRDVQPRGGAFMFAVLAAAWALRLRVRRRARVSAPPRA